MSSDLPLETIRDHYERIAPVMAELAEVGDCPTIGLNDYSGWYVRRDHEDFELIDEGFDQEARCATLSTDYETVRNRIERALYAVTTYKSRDAFVDWEPCTIEDGTTVWKTDSPTPSYGDLRGVMVWGDIDLADELKPQRGDLDDETQDVIEATLEAYIEEYARLYGDREAVFGLDSVGGSYVMGAPAATVPIAEIFDEDADARERVMEALVDRSNDWLKDAQVRVEERVDGAGEVIDPDWVNNCNRQYKAPLSLHADHDAVVVPLDTDNPTYALVQFEDVDEDLIEQTASWAKALTSTEYRDRAETLVKRLWPDEYESHDGWESALEAWVEAEREREERQEEARKRARERRRERKEKMGGLAEGAPVTPFISDVFDALDALDIEDVAERTIVHQWTDRASGKRDNSGDGKRAFIPTWGPNAESGNANFVDLDSGVWVDTGDDYSGGPVKMALIAEENWNRGKTPSGEDWRRGVDYLRELGYEIPVWTPDANSQDAEGDEYEQMAYWSVRKAAVALGVLPEDGFIRAERSSGGYLSFPGKESYNHALAAIEDAGLKHGREYYTEDGSRPDNAADHPSEDAATTTVSTLGNEQSSPPESDGESGSGEKTGIYGAHSELDVESGGYGYWNTNHDTGESWFERVTNFTIDVDSFLFDNGDRLIDMTVTPATGEDPYDLKIETKVFNDARRFRDNVVTGLTTTFEGGPSDLNELRKLVGGQDAPVRTGTHHMGLHPDAGEFVTPQGVLTEDGWIDDPETAYIEREISAERAWSLTPDENDEYDAEQVAEILELVPKSRFSERFLPAVGWVYTAPLRPYVQEWEGQFNTLHVTGETGAGKSSTLSVLWQLIGMNGEPMACDDTKFALLTSMASTNSIPMWFDEYKPGDMKDWEVDRFQSLMRSTTRGGIATRGNADKSTEEYELKAPLMISGEQSIQGPAEERRSIQTRFREGVKEPGSPTKRAFAQLTGMAYDAGGETVEPDGYDLEQHALAYHQFVLRQNPGELKDLWRKSRDEVRELLTDNSITGVDDLPRQGLQTIHFGMALYSRFAERMVVEAGKDVDQLDLPSTAELNDALLYIGKQFGDDGGRKSHLDQFIELTARAATEDYLEEGTHFKFVNEGKPDEELALKLSSVHDRVSKYVRDHGLDSTDLLNNAADYRDRMSEEAEDASSYVSTHSQKTPPLARCARINTRVAEEELEFSRLSFGAEPRDEEEEGTEGGDDDDPSAFGARPLTDVAEDPTGYATVTVEILTIEQPDHDHAPAMKATVKDRTTAIDVVSWSDAGALPDDGAVVIENAEVGKYEGTVQLTVRSGVTEVKQIQPGVGYTETVPADEDQDQLDDTPRDAAGQTEAASDGGTLQADEDEVESSEPDGESRVPDDAEGLLPDAQRLRELLEQHGVAMEQNEILVEASANQGLMTPDRAKKALKYAVKRKGIIMKTGKGYVPS